MALLGAAGLLVVSGYLLYYLGNERAREVTGIVHWGMGLSCPAVFLAHRVGPRALRAGRRARENARAA